MGTSAAPPERQAPLPGQSNKPLSQPAHGLPGQQVLQELRSSDARGLDGAEAARRLLEYGPNELDKAKGVQPLKIFLEQIFNAMTLVLVLALAASFGIRAWIESGILAGIVVLNVFIGFFQSLQAERTIDSLRTLGTPTCRVLRDGEAATVQSAGVVPGDVVLVTAGDSVPADIRLTEAIGLEADEALLTGESVPTLKNAKLVLDPDTGPGDRLNTIFSSTLITKGRGRGVVVATGMHTEIGLIASALNAREPEVADAAESGERGTIPFVKSTFRAARRWLGEFLGLTVGTPLQRKLSQLFLGLLVCAVICAVVVLGANEFQAHNDVVIYAITTAIGTIPVSLLLVLTLTMAAGAKVMLGRNVIVRTMSSLEALGGVTNICSDKTGTITQGRMTVRKAWVPGIGTYSVDASNDVYNPIAGTVRLLARHQPKDADDLTPPLDLLDEKTAATGRGGGEGEEISPLEEVGSKQALQRFLDVASLANLATIRSRGDGIAAGPGEWQATGAPTEIAIEVFASRFGWSRSRRVQGGVVEWVHVAEFPFSSDIKKMTVLFDRGEETHVLTKGAVERVLDCCTSIAIDDVPHPLSDDLHDAINANMEALAGQGLRVLALAHKINSFTVPIPSSEDVGSAFLERDAFERDLVFRGLVGIYDPPRPESRASIQMCHGAGITVHMLTGDHVQTARSIAVDVGILPPARSARPSPAAAAAERDALVMTAHDFDALTDAQVDALPRLPLVVARCAPGTKVRMIDALHRRGRYVAMTGDGVNDSPSLKRADVGIAMGTGSDVAKQASEIVLSDDNFASILNAIEEGRRIFDNIQKFILHVLAANISFVATLLAGLAFKDRSGISVFQLSPVEILWMLLGTGAFCETGLGFERAVPDILARPPQNLKYGVFTPEFLVDMLVYGVSMCTCVLGSFTLVIFGFNGGNLGSNCNLGYSEDCEAVFRARATCYTTMTWIFLLFAWGLIDLRRSLFDMPNGVRTWAMNLWENKFLFFSVTVVFVLVIPTLYIPGLNRVVFLHKGIDWEWAVVFVGVAAFVAMAELWKWMKRVYFRRQLGRMSRDRLGDEQA